MSQAVTADIEKTIEDVLLRYQGQSSSLIGVLQDVQAVLHHLPEEALRMVAERLGVPMSRVYNVATFYNAFTLEPRGKHIVKVCMGTACHVRGAPRILDEISRHLQISAGETTDDGEFTLETVNCLGACALGPVVVIDDKYYNANPGTTEKLLQDAREGKEPASAVIIPTEMVKGSCTCDRLKSGTVGVAVCGGTGCQAYGCNLVASALEQMLDHHGIREQVHFIQTGCHGFCERGPIVVVRPDNIFYQHVRPEDVPEIIERTVLKGEVIERLLFTDPADGQAIEKEGDIPFYAGQQRIVFGDNGHISPVRIDDYLQYGGYAGLAKALTMTPDAIIEEITRSGLRGRGGGGFPTGKKWRTCRSAHGDPKYVICNADEGDPGAYMDRSLLEGNPHRVLEGMIIGAYAVGSPEGYVYVRDEYPLAVKHINLAIEHARERGYLGTNILGSGFDFDIRVVRGGGAFVCGESTALMTSLEGKAGEPRAKYVHTVDSGLWEKPSNLNNVETWANVPLIISRGANWYASIGTEGSKGTKIFSLVGKIVNTGLVEVPMGITLRKMIFEIGGGIPGGRHFKAVQTGGPSGGCLPESMLDLAVDFDELTKVGSMMGSGGMIVMDDRSCMVDVARYFLNFLREESCGKCTPCREGTLRMFQILDRITRGEGQPDDLALLDDLAKTLEAASLCALGSTAANPVMSTLRYFRDEYEAHIVEKRCPAGVCKALISFTIDAEKCTGCGACRRKCPVNAITGDRKVAHVIAQDLCIKCGACAETCRFEAVIQS
ncbi:MAG: NAD(P)H-dependent oxidoreductase subunit E [Armatimonadota bacterium]